MSQRSLETLTDILILIVSPILVMIMVGSLAFFLIQCLYIGEFFGRLNFATGLFVMAAVLVARIAIEEGREYASGFALPLGVVTILSILRYTDLGPLFAIPLVLFIWWSTDKLTWDCTVLDESKDASGEGLLQTVGLDEKTDSDEATTDRGDVETQSIWKKWLDRRRRHHTPGVWVIYFGLAAIPLFGIGQMMLSDTSRGAGFLLLCTYVAAALALLMITSFLQMRRYLIQRRLPFSEKMAAVWLGTGGTMIIALMIFCLILPRPNTGYSLVDSLSSTIGHVNSRDDLKTSDWAVGEEGVEDEERSGRGRKQSDNNTAESDTPQQGNGKGQGRQREGQRNNESEQNSSRQGQGEQSQSEQSQSEQGQSGRRGEQNRFESGQNREGRQRDRQDNSSRQSSQDTQANESDRGESDRNDPATDEDRSQENRARNDRSRNSRSENDARRDDSGQDSDHRNDSDQRPDADNESSSSNSRFRPPEIPNPLQNLSLPPIPRLVYIALVLLGVLVLMFFYGRQIMAAVSAFLRDFLAILFGRKKESAQGSDVEEAPAAVTPPSFSSFRNPFTSGMAQRLNPQQLVAYSFDALQAWAFEHQCGRDEDQTPLEFAGQISRSHQAVGQHARNLAMLYNQAAYAPQSLGNHAVQHVQALWTALSRTKTR